MDAHVVVRIRGNFRGDGRLLAGSDSAEPAASPVASVHWQPRSGVSWADEEGGKQRWHGPSHLVAVDTVHQQMVQVEDEKKSFLKRGVNLACFLDGSLLQLQSLLFRDGEPRLSLLLLLIPWSLHFLVAPTPFLDPAFLLLPSWSLVPAACLQRPPRGKVRRIQSLVSHLTFA